MNRAAPSARSLCAKFNRPAGLTALLTALAAAPAALGDDERGLAPLAVAVDEAGHWAYIAQAAARQVVAFDLCTRRIERAFPASGEPTGLALSPNRRRLYVTCAGPEGTIDVFDLGAGGSRELLRAGHTPMSPVVSPDGKWLYVCNRFGNSISAIDCGSTETSSAGAAPLPAAVIPVVREPAAAALSPDGRYLLVANHLPAGAADSPHVAAGVSVVDTAAGKTVGFITLPNGSTSLRGLALSPDGQYAYVTHILARYQLPTTQLDRGWMNTNAVSVIDAAKARWVNTVLLDEPESGAANPWGVGCSADGRWLCVAHAGTHEISVIDRVALHEKLARAAGGERVSEVSAKAGDVPNDLTFLGDIRRRVRLGGRGPRGLAVAGGIVCAAEYFSDSIGLVTLHPEGRPAVESLPLGPEPLLTAARRGERLFNDATICFQQWQSCASCHPDARADGLNWDLLNDGIGNPKNTRSLLKVHETPPAMSLGVRKDARAAIDAGLRHILFTHRPAEDVDVIAAYLGTLEPVRWVRPSDERPQAEAIERGRAVFATAGCAECHTSPLYTDGRSYDVGTGQRDGEPRRFDTPTLMEVWRTGPYLHDGRAATLRDVLQGAHADDRHGRTTRLSAEELDALRAFLESL